MGGAGEGGAQGGGGAGLGRGGRAHLPGRGGGGRPVQGAGDVLPAGHKGRILTFFRKKLNFLLDILEILIV